MIRFVTPDLEPLLQDKLSDIGIFGTKIYSQYATYGAQSDVVEFWLLFERTQLCGAISRLDGRFTVAAGALCDAQLDELAGFLQAAGGRTVEGELALLARLQAIVRGEPVISSQIWRWAGQPPRVATLPVGVTISRAASLQTVYRLLCTCDQAFAAEAQYDAWLCDLSHKTRHHLAEVFTLSVEDVVVSTQSILFIGQANAILASVATASDARRRGYAGMLLAAVTAAALERGLTPHLLAASDALGSFYAGHGFAPVGRWGCLSLGGNHAAVENESRD